MYIENEFEGWFLPVSFPFHDCGGFAMVAFGIVKKPAESSKTDACELTRKEYVLIANQLYRHFCSHCTFFVLEANIAERLNFWLRF